LLLAAIMGGIKIPMLDVILNFGQKGKCPLVGIQMPTVLVRVNPVSVAPEVDIKIKKAGSGFAGWAE
jgi:hypothetical protein